MNNVPVATSIVNSGAGYARNAIVVATAPTVANQIFTIQVNSVNNVGNILEYTIIFTLGDLTNGTQITLTAPVGGTSAILSVVQIHIKELL